MGLFDILLSGFTRKSKNKLVSINIENIDQENVPVKFKYEKAFDNGTFAHILFLNSKNKWEYILGDIKCRSNGYNGREYYARYYYFKVPFDPITKTLKELEEDNLTILAELKFKQEQYKLEEKEKANKITNFWNNIKE